MHEWAVIDGYNGKYEINRFGVIKNTITGKILVPSTSKTGYQFVKLNRPDSTRKNALVHRLVAEVFIQNPLKKPQVNHIDGNKRNNCVDNLEWVTPSENIKHSFSTLGKTSPMQGRKGILNKNSVPIYQYDLDGNFVKKWPAVSDAAKALNCNPSQIINQMAGRIVTCHGYLWSYEKTERIDNSRVKQRKTHKQWGI